MRFVIATALIWATAGPVGAHGGGLDANGCHNDRRRGGYHCHRGPSVSATPTRPTPKEDRDRPQTLFGGAAAYNSDVETTQRLLIKLGYDPGEPDGRLGERTQIAIRAFESDNGLLVTGEVTQNLINAMIDKVSD
jgi:Putative peptidoglycan binding domain